MDSRKSGLVMSCCTVAVLLGKRSAAVLRLQVIPGSGRVGTVRTLEVGCEGCTLEDERSVIKREKSVEE